MTSPTLSRLATAAFPLEYRSAADKAAETLKPFVDPTYHRPTVEAQVLGRKVSIPTRIHFFSGAGLPSSANGDLASLVQECLCTRSTDGYLRQQALRAIINCADPAAIPFIVLLAGEYVVEIIEDILLAVPTMDQAAYANFVHENRQVMRGLRAKATSYWDCYYREPFPNRSDYPGLAFLHQIERWAT